MDEPCVEIRTALAGRCVSPAFGPRPWLLPAVIVMLLACGSPGVAQRPVTVPDRLACPECEISVRVVVEMGVREGPGSLAGMPRRVREDGRGRYWILSPGEPPMVFGSGGGYLATIGRRGEGPGEFLQPADAIPLPGDSMLVVDNALARATVIGPDLSASRSIRLPGEMIVQGSVVSWPEEIVVNGIFRDTARVGWPLHVLSFAGGTARVARSFGANRGELRPGPPDPLVRALSSASRGTVWSGEKLRYRLMEWGPTEGLVRMLERSPVWFSGQSSGERLLGTPSTPPPPAVLYTEMDDSGRLWVFVRVAAPTWQIGWPRSVPAEAMEVSVGDIRIDRLFETRIEVIDPAAARVVARYELAPYVVGALRGGRAAFYTPAADGTPRISVVQLVLSGPDSGR